MRIHVACFSIALLVAGLPGAAAADDTLALRAGAVVLTAPKYEGSKEYRVIGAPVILPDVGDEPGRIQFKGLDEIRVRLLSANGFEFGPSAGYRIGRDEEDGRRLHGLGDIDGGLALGGYAAFRISPLTASVGYSHQVTGDDTGGLLRFDLDYRQRLSQRIMIRAGIGGTWADDDYMQARFGVTTAQSARSRLTAYAPSAGVKDVRLSLGTTIDLDSRWALMLNGQYTRLVGDAADSPVVETADQFSAMVGLTYRFEIANPFRR